MIVEERNIDVGGLPAHHLTAGERPPLVLLHALGESALDWQWVLPGPEDALPSASRTGQRFTSRASSRGTPDFIVLCSVPPLHSFNL